MRIEIHLEIELPDFENEGMVANYLIDKINYDEFLNDTELIDGRLVKASWNVSKNKCNYFIKPRPTCGPTPPPGPPIRFTW